MNYYFVVSAIVRLNFFVKIVYDKAKNLSFIPWRIDLVQQCIQVMPQLLGEHSDHLLITGRLQPVLVQVDRLRADGIGPSCPWH